MVTKATELLEMARDLSIITARQIRDAGINASTVSAAVEAGTLKRINRGVYQHVDATWTEHFNLTEVIARVPKAIVVLQSALEFHRIGSHQAHNVWILLPSNAVTPRVNYPPLKVIRSSHPDAFSKGIEEHSLNDVPVAITSVPRTIADCFKHRNKLGLELCLEALKEVMQSGTTANEILPFARMNRVENIMIPYLESLT